MPCGAVSRGIETGGIVGLLLPWENGRFPFDSFGRLSRSGQVPHKRFAPVRNDNRVQARFTNQSQYKWKSTSTAISTLTG